MFEDFLGEIPEENIDEILDAKNTLTEIKDINVYSNRYKNLVSQISDSYIGEWCNEALLSSIDEEPYQEWKWNGRPDYYEAFTVESLTPPDISLPPSLRLALLTLTTLWQ